MQTLTQYDLLITNQGKMADDILHDVSQRNISAIIFPLYESVRYQIPSQTWQNILRDSQQDNHYLAISSSFCAKLFIEAVTQSFAQNQINKSAIHLLAPGKSTANILLAHFPNVTFPADNATAGLITTYPSNSRITLLTQSKSRKALEFSAHKHNITLTQVNLYRRIPLHLNPRQLQILRQCEKIVIASADSLFRYRLLVDTPQVIVTLYPRIKMIADNLRLNCKLIRSYLEL